MNTLAAQKSTKLADRAGTRDTCCVPAELASLRGSFGRRSDERTNKGRDTRPATPRYVTRACEEKARRKKEHRTAGRLSRAFRPASALR